MTPRRWLTKRKATAFLSDLAQTMAIDSLRLALFDSRGQLLAALPDDSGATAWEPIVARVRQMQEEVVTTDGAVLPLTAHGELAGVLAAHASDGWPERRLPALRAACSVLTRLAEAEMDKRALAQETLDRYREINLLYRIGETIGAAVDLDEVTDLVLQESMNTIQAAKGLVMMMDKASGDLVVKARRGAVMPMLERWPLTQGILGEVGRDGKPQIINDTTSDPRAQHESAVFTSLLCVPLKTRDRLLGILALGDKVPGGHGVRSGRRGTASSPALSDVQEPGGMFTAGDQNLLMALASQAAVAIDTALEVQAREERLKQQIRDLRIEIDHVKKARQVAEITESDYFQRLRAEARRLRAQSKQD